MTNPADQYQFWWPVSTTWSPKPSQALWACYLLRKYCQRSNRVDEITLCQTQDHALPPFHRLDKNSINPFSRWSTNIKREQQQMHIKQAIQLKKKTIIIRKQHYLQDKSVSAILNFSKYLHYSKKNIWFICHKIQSSIMLHEQWTQF